MNDNGGTITPEIDTQDRHYRKVDRQLKKELDDARARARREREAKEADEL